MDLLFAFNVLTFGSVVFGIVLSSEDIRSEMAYDIFEILLPTEFALRLLDQKVRLLFS